MIRNKLLFKIVKKLNFVLKILAINYNICRKCKIPFKYVEPKPIFPTKYNKIECVCVHCWEESSLEELKAIHKEEYFKKGGNWRVGLNNVLNSIKK